MFKDQALYLSIPRKKTIGNEPIYIYTNAAYKSVFLDPGVRFKHFIAQMVCVERVGVGSL